MFPPSCDASEVMRLFYLVTFLGFLLHTPEKTAGETGSACFQPFFVPTYFSCLHFLDFSPLPHKGGERFSNHRTTRPASCDSPLFRRSSDNRSSFILCFFTRVYFYFVGRQSSSIEHRNNSHSCRSECPPPCLRDVATANCCCCYSSKRISHVDDARCGLNKCPANIKTFALLRCWSASGFSRCSRTACGLRRFFASWT